MSMVSDSGQWWYDEVRAGTVGTNSLRDVLQGARLEGAELFVREVTQNAIDAFAGGRGEPVRMRFRSELATEKASGAIREFLLGSSDAREHWRAVSEADQREQNQRALGELRSGTKRIRVHVVEDFGTVGLGGRIGGRGPSDHFSRLIYFFGETHGEGSTGGAYGFGKTVLSVASRVRTVVYYSLPRPSAEDLTPESRLIGVSLLPPHTIQGTEYTGYALCGVLCPDDQRFPVHPITGSEADHWARRLGLSPRAEQEFGTSIMVIDCDYEMTEVRSALEEWWWPRILSLESGRLEATLEVDGQVVSPPDPRSNPKIQPFVPAYERLRDGTGTDGEVVVKKLRGLGRRPLGTLALRSVSLEEDRQQTAAVDEGKSYDRCVAVFRSPKLVVEYLRAGTDALPPFVGVFAADPVVDPILRKSEPPAHDRWAPESSRLDRESREHTVVGGVERQICRYSREFQRKQVPPPKDTPSHLRELESLLGRIFQNGRAPGPVPPGPERKVHLSVLTHRDYEKREDVARIELEPAYDNGGVSGRLCVDAELVGDAKLSKLADLPVRLLSEDGAQTAEGSGLTHDFTLRPGGSLCFEARVPSSSDGKTRFKVRVEGEEQE